MIKQYWTPCGSYLITETEDTMRIFDDFRINNNAIMIQGREDIEFIKDITDDFNDDKAIRYAFASYPTFDA